MEFNFITAEARSFILYSFSRLLLLLISVVTLVVNIGFLGQGIVRPAFSQGQFHCTNGSTVDRPSECPSSDQCPSESSQNGLVDCIPKSSTEQKLQEHFSSKSPPPTVASLLQSSNPFLENTHDSNIFNEKATITIKTDKQFYSRGELVKITILNNSSGTLRFDNTKSVIIKNLNTGERYLPSLLSKSRILPPHESVHLDWDQQNVKGEQVNSGNYSSSVSLDSLNANTTFSISK